VGSEEVERLKNAFISDGFDPSILQVIKEGQIWGAAKTLDANNELHIRIMNTWDGRECFLLLESEIEVPREYLEHLSNDFPAEPCYGHVVQILHHYQIPYEVVGQLPADPLVVTRPTQPTPWKPILALFGVLAAFIGLARLSEKAPAS
jgi:hypothetical protein